MTGSVAGRVALVMGAGQVPGATATAARIGWRR